MFKLKLAVGGKHVQGSIQPADAGLHRIGEALATAVKAAPEPAAAVAPVPVPATSAPTAVAPSASSSSSSKPPTTSIGGINLSKVSLAPMGMTDRHGVSPAMLFPRAKPLERTQLNIAPVALSSFQTTLPVRTAPAAAAAPMTSSSANASASEAPKKKSKAKKAAVAAKSPSQETAKPKPAPIDVAAPSTSSSATATSSSSSSSSSAGGNAVASPIPSTPSTPSSTASGEADAAHAVPSLKAKKPKKPKAEREIDSAVLRAGVTAGEYRATLRAYSADLITAICTELGVSDRRKNHLLTTLPASTLNAFVNRQNAAFAPLLTAPNAAPATAAAAAVPAPAAAAPEGAKP